MKKANTRLAAILLALVMILTVMPVAAFAEDVTAPLIRDVKADPSTAKPGDSVTISAEVTDDSGIKIVTLSIIDFGEKTIVAETAMALSSEQTIYEATITIPSDPLDVTNGDCKVIITATDDAENTETSTYRPLTITGGKNAEEPDPTPIIPAKLEGITAPVTGATPSTNVSVGDGEHYEAELMGWIDVDAQEALEGNFAAETVYAAYGILTADQENGYYFDLGESDKLENFKPEGADSITIASVALEALGLVITYPATKADEEEDRTYTATLYINEDDVPYDGGIYGLTLVNENNASVTREMLPGSTDATMTATVPNGKWKVYWDDSYTGVDIEINDDDANATLDLYSYEFDWGFKGTAATGGSFREEKTNNGGEKFTYDIDDWTGLYVKGEAVTYTAEGEGADSYTYEWSGTYNGSPINVTGDTYTIASIEGPLEIICTITGKSGGSTLYDIDLPGNITANGLTAAVSLAAPNSSFEAGTEVWAWVDIFGTATEAGKMVTNLTSPEAGLRGEEILEVEAGDTLDFFNNFVSYPFSFPMPEKDVTLDLSFTYIANNAPLLAVGSLSFGSAKVGDALPAAELITIIEKNGVAANISSVTVSDTENWEITTGENVVEANGTNETWKVGPTAKAMETAGNYFAVITVTYNGGAKTTGIVSFTVEPKDVDPIDPDPVDPPDDDDDDDDNDWVPSGDDDDDNDDDRRSSSGGGGSSSTPAATSNTPSTPVTTAKATDAANAAVQAAQASGITTATANLKNPGDISLDALQAMDEAADMPIKLQADSTVGNAVDVRITLDPALATEGMNLSASTVSAAAKKTAATFEKYFSNKIATVSFGQAGSFGQRVEVAAKVDLALMDTKRLVFYAYDPKTNSYKRIEQPEYWIDANGYLHFKTEFAGEIVISEGELEKR